MIFPFFRVTKAASPDRRLFRQNRLIYAVLTSGLSKFLALLSQIVGFPLALHALGTDRYASFLALQSLLAWVGLCGLGLAPTLPKLIAAAAVTEDHDGEKDVVVTAIVLTGAMTILVFAVLCAIGLLASPARLVSAAPGISAHELAVGYFAAAAVACAQLFISIAPAIRSGYQELYHTNFCSVVANILVLAGLIYIGRHGPASIWWFFAVLNLPLTMLLLLDTALLFRQRPYLWGPAHLRLTVGRIVGHSGSALAVQVAFALCVYLPTLVVAHLTTPGDLAAFGSILQMLFLAVASMNFIFLPMTSAMADAHSHKDLLWLRSSYRRSFALVVAIGMAAIVVFATIGSWLVRHWLGGGVQVSRGMMTVFGVYFLFLAVTQFHFYVLSAMSILPGVGRYFILQGVMGLALGAMLCTVYGATGMVLGLTIGIAAVTGWLLPLRVRRAFNVGGPPAQERH